MSAPRLEIDLDKITHNARVLVEDLGERGIAVTGVTKAALGAVEVAKAMLRAGVSGGCRKLLLGSVFWWCGEWFRVFARFPGTAFVAVS